MDWKQHHINICKLQPEQKKQPGCEGYPQKSCLGAKPAAHKLSPAALTKLLPIPLTIPDKIKGDICNQQLIISVSQAVKEAVSIMS